MSKIIRIQGREIIDSRGNPTVEADVISDDGSLGRAAVPSGASTGKREAIELRDEVKTRFNGKGVSQAVAAVNGEIQSALKGLEVVDQTTIDQRMIDLDGTENKSRLGANALLAVSLAAAKAAAQSNHTPLYRYLSNDADLKLPVPMINILNGGAHASNSTDIQEFMVVPVGADSMRMAVQIGAEIFHALKRILKNKGYQSTVGDEGGFAPQLKSNEAAIELVLEAIEQTGYKAGREVYLALDAASSEFFHDQHYYFASEDRKLSTEELITIYEQWVKQYPIISIEDGLTEDDWEGWQCLTQRLGHKIQLVGDDLFVTNTQAIGKGIDLGVANAVLVKFNQIGTLSETLAAIDMAKKADYACIISHRSGETEDTTIADLAVATGVGQIKTGSLSRTDRVAKYNQLLRIEEALTGQCQYTGTGAFAKFLES